MAATESKPPNIVLIFTDNQQASTLGCYGNSEIYTPHLDQLAAEGFTFDNAFCPNAFCSPCRASVLTGLMPSQHGVHSWIDDRKSDQWPVGWHALQGLQTLPLQLKNQGYATALCGKYHLGEPVSPAEGFDSWVTLEDGHVRSFYNNKIYDNGKSYTQPGHSVDFFTAKAIEFIDAQKQQPFFLFLPYPAPYGHWPATREPVRCRHAERYDNCAMESVPRTALSKDAVDGFLMSDSGSSADLDFSMLMRAPNDLDTLRNYYAQVSMVDEGVGHLHEHLQSSGLSDNTLFIFTTDHGLSVGQHGFWGHGGSTFPSNLHRAAHSIPMIIKQPGLGAAGRRSKLMVSNLDLYATILDHTGVEVDADIASASRSLLPVIRAEDLTQWGDDVVFSEQEETRVLRTPKWAYFQRCDAAGDYPIGHALYDIELDPQETENLAGKLEFADIEKSLQRQLDDFFAQYSRPEANLWSGGTAIQNSLRPQYWQNAWGKDWSPVYHYDDPA